MPVIKTSDGAEIFYKDWGSVASGPFYGFNRPGAMPSEAIVHNWWRQGMAGGAKAHYDGIVAFSQTDFSDDLKKITVPVLVMHGDDDQIVPYPDSAPLTAQRQAEDLQGISAWYANHPFGDHQQRHPRFHHRIDLAIAADFGPDGDGNPRTLDRADSRGLKLTRSLMENTETDLNRAIRDAVAADSPEVEDLASSTPAVYDIPKAVGFAVVGAFGAVVLCFMFFFGGSAQSRFVTVVTLCFCAVYCAIPFILIVLTRKSAWRGTWFSFQRNGLSIRTGHVRGKEALLQILVLPICLFVAAVGMGVIWALYR